MFLNILFCVAPYAVKSQYSFVNIDVSNRCIVAAGFSHHFVILNSRLGRYLVLV